MATVHEKMTAIADPMRTLSGRTDKLSLDEMAAFLTDANDEVSSQADLIAQISTALEGKAGSGDGITPTGTKQITTNGTHDVTTYANAEVNVPVGVFPTGTKEITANGEYDVTSYAKTKVNVPSEETVTKELSVTTNGTYTPDAGVDGYSKVTVNVPTSGTTLDTCTVTLINNHTNDVYGTVWYYNSINSKGVPIFMTAFGSGSKTVVAKTVLAIQSARVTSDPLSCSTEGNVVLMADGITTNGDYFVLINVAGTGTITIG